MPSLATSADPPPLLARIAGQVAAYPEIDALVCEGERMSYRALWEQAEAMAASLRGAALRPGGRVVIEGARSAAQFVAILGTLIACGIYVPLSERAPPERQALIVAESGARHRIVDDVVERIASASDEPDSLPPGYLLFTSGTTGTPKGVRISLASLSAYVDNILRFYPLAPGANAAQLADLGFDASVHEIFTAWAAGATLQVIPTRNALMWPRYFKSFAIEAALLVPTQVRLAAQHGLLRPDSLPSVRRLFLGAELVTGHIVTALRAAAPAAELVCLWGPTEGTVALTHHPIIDTPGEAEGAAIGTPWPGHDILLDDAADGIGEMWAAGPQLCDGYWRAPERTAERFVERDGRTYYRTGDLARRDATGDLLFAGRRDRQVKIKGHRVELEECELAIRRLSGTDDAVALLVGEELVAFVAPAAIEGLGAALRQALPSYMVPARYVPVSTFPMTASGKVDLAALRTLAQQPDQAICLS
jgi:amino acid adenylation domain-containing protein